MLEQGRIFGKWTVQKCAEKSGKHTKYTCICECGKVSDVDGYSLSSGHSKSCGCYGKRVIGEKNRSNSMRHGGHVGGKASAEYSAWSAMKSRCANPRNRKFSLYGGRGITVCAEWADSFERFLSDVGFRPSEQHSLDRIDGGLGYFKENVRWADSKTQNKNRSNTRWIEVDGENLSLMEFCKKLDIKYSTACKRWRLGKRRVDEFSDLVGCRGNVG